MTDTTHEYVEYTDRQRRRVVKLTAALLLNSRLKPHHISVALLSVLGCDADWLAADYGVTRNRAQQWRLRTWRKTAEMLGAGDNVDLSDVFDQEARV